MLVGAVQSNEYPTNPNLSNVIKTTTAGAAVGLAAKYIVPLTKEELGDLNTATKAAKQFAENTALHLKHIRPTRQFVLTGLFAGFLAGVADNVFRTNVRSGVDTFA